MDGMIVLALDAVSHGASAAVLIDGRLAGVARHSGHHGQAEHLMTLVADALGQAGLRAGDANLIAATRGPGSFTGIRVTLAAARGLALAIGRPLLGVSAGDAVAAALDPDLTGGASSSGALMVAIESRRAEVFATLYEPGPAADPADRQVGEIEALTVAAAAARLARWQIRGQIRGEAQEQNGGTSLAGCAAERLLAAWTDDVTPSAVKNAAGSGMGARPRLAGTAGPDAVAVARLAALRLVRHGLPQPGESVTPLYIRPPTLGGQERAASTLSGLP